MPGPRADRLARPTRQIRTMLSLVTIVGCVAMPPTARAAASWLLLTRDRCAHPGSLTSAFVPPANIAGVQRVAVSPAADISMMVRCCQRWALQLCTTSLAGMRRFWTGARDAAAGAAPFAALSQTSAVRGRS